MVKVGRKVERQLSGFIMYLFFFLESNLIKTRVSRSKLNIFSKPQIEGRGTKAVSLFTPLYVIQK